MLILRGHLLCMLTNSQFQVFFLKWYVYSSDVILVGTFPSLWQDEEVLEVFQKVHSGQLRVGIMAQPVEVPQPVDCEVTRKGSVQSL